MYALSRTFKIATLSVRKYQTIFARKADCSTVAWCACYLCRGKSVGKVCKMRRGFFCPESVAILTVRGKAAGKSLQNVSRIFAPGKCRYLESSGQGSWQKLQNDKCVADICAESVAILKVRERHCIDRILLSRVLEYPAIVSILEYSSTGTVRLYRYSSTRVSLARGSHMSYPGIMWSSGRR